MRMLLLNLDIYTLLRWMRLVNLMVLASSPLECGHYNYGDCGTICARVAFAAQVSPSAPTLFLTAVYASCELSNRIILWNNLKTMANLVNNIPWLVLGDFNEVLENAEKFGGLKISHKGASMFRTAYMTVNSLI